MKRLLLIILILSMFLVSCNSAKEREIMEIREMVKNMEKPLPVMVKKDFDSYPKYHFYDFDDIYGFSLFYSSDWKEDYIERENVLLDLKSSDGLSAITIKKYSNEDMVTQKEMNEYHLSEDFKDVVQQTEGIDNLEVESGMIKNIPIVKSTYIETFMMEGISYSYKTMTIYIVKDNEMFLGINYVSLPENFNQNLAKAEEIIESFRFTKEGYIVQD
jgi:hypothetical protein